MKTYTVKYFWFKLIRTTQVSAYTPAAAQLEFERVNNIDKRNIFKII